MAKVYCHVNQCDGTVQYLTRPTTTLIIIMWDLPDLKYSQKHPYFQTCSRTILIFCCSIFTAPYLIKAHNMCAGNQSKCMIV